MSNWSGEGGNWGRAYELMEERKRRNLTAQISLQEVNDIFNAAKRQEKEASMGYLNRQLNPFRVGDSVKLKDSPYTGKITTLEAGSGVTFKSILGPHISVTDDTLLERVIDPQAGDIYEDINGNDWVVLQYGSSKEGSHPFLTVQLIGVRPAGYPHRSFVLASHGKRPSNLEMWISAFEPKLVRRRGQ